MKLSKKGFTLIELLVVIAIIGILAAIAIPQFQAYRQRGFDSSAKSDLRNAATAEEAYFVTNTTYLSCSNTACTATTALQGLRAISTGTALVMTGTATTFTGTSTNSKGTSTVYTWNSASGGLQ